MKRTTARFTVIEINTVSGYGKVILYILITALFIPPAYSQPCDEPSGLQITGNSSCSATLNWNPVSNAESYSLAWKQIGDTAWYEEYSGITETSFQFYSLLPSSPIQLSVQAKCPTSESNESTANYFTGSCGLPVITEARSFYPKSIFVKWTGCLTPYNKVRFRNVNSTTWHKYFTGQEQEILIDSLEWDQDYIVEINICNETGSDWLTSDTIRIRRPNVLLIVLDDARFDSYGCNSGPAFFESPNIDRIANEGVNFKQAHAVFSYCTPGRASLLTGLYPHTHGAVHNSGTTYPGIKLLNEIFDSAGYYTAMIGKHWEWSQQPEWDYWLASGGDYFTGAYNYNGIQKPISGHDTEVIRDSVIKAITASNDPFFIWAGFHAPHNPFEPQAGYENYYAGETMPVPLNTKRYQKNYMNWLYDISPNYYIDSADIPVQYELYFNVLKGLDDAVGDLFSALEAGNKLDNTIIAFTSDNGFLFGEHGLFNKRLPYDPSTRIPMFLRFPDLLQAGSAVENDFALNIDMAPTLLEICHVNTGVQFQGKSLLPIYEGTDERKSFLYEYLYDEDLLHLPDIRSVRTFDYRYTEYGCVFPTHEFFNLNLDSMENKNRIYDPLWQSAIDSLRLLLAELRAEFQDTANIYFKYCELVDTVPYDTPKGIYGTEILPNPNWISDFYMEEKAGTEQNSTIQISPNPSSGKLLIESAQAGSVRIVDITGRIMYEEIEKKNFHELDNQEWPAGTYMIVVNTEKEIEFRKWLKL